VATDGDFLLYLPTNAAARGPLQVLVAVHGMNGNGVAFAAPLRSTAERNGWILVAPTFHYRDNITPAGVLRDDTVLLPRLKQYLDDLPAKTGLPIRQKVLLYGFSRGAQIVHRFAEFYPGRTLAVALFAAGNYTLPVSTLDVRGTLTTLDLPFGIADLRAYTGAPFDAAAFRAVPFFIGVGAADDRAGDAPPAWDAYEGVTRLARAQFFAGELNRIGVDASLALFPGVGHEITPEMRDQALAFLTRRAVSEADRPLLAPPGPLDPAARLEMNGTRLATDARRIRLAAPARSRTLPARDWAGPPMRAGCPPLRV
jgi:predicted esterase